MHASQPKAKSKAKPKAKAKEQKKAGPKANDGPGGLMALTDEKVFRVRGYGVLLTYQRFTDVDKAWKGFLDFVSANLSAWKVKHWCATMEANEVGGYHFHLMLQFYQEQDRTTKAFIYEGAQAERAGY